ncbi:MAG TPA: hypothetical protein VGD50_04665, partial [Candidatus Baltobacteraceae bacterium]
MPFTRHGPGSLLALPSGSIASDLKAISIDERSRVATYELLVANETIAPVATFAYAVGATPGGMMSWSTITVPAFASIAVTIDVPLPPRGKEQRVVVELHAEDAHLTLDANAPVARRRLGRAGYATIAAAAVFAIGSLVFSLEKPRVLALAAPSPVVAGRPFAVAYALGGDAQGTYVVETTDGYQVRRGALDRKRSAMMLDLPLSNQAQGYDLSVTASGKFGAETRVAHITAVPTPPTAPPQVIAPVVVQQQQQTGLPSIALATDTVSSGGEISITYPLANASGSVTLFDQSNAVRGTALLDRSGHATLVAPVVTADEPFRVVVQVQSGTSTVESATGLTVKAQQPATPPPDQAGVSADTETEAGLPFGLPVGTVKGGGIIRIPIASHEDGLNIGLSTADGTVLSSVDVALS